MEQTIVVQEAPLDDAITLYHTIPEFEGNYKKEAFEKRCHRRDHLILTASVSRRSAGFLVGYDKFGDGSFYCWMAGVQPAFRRRGVLTALMAYQEQWARQRGYRTIRIKTRNSRREMLTYLVKNSFLFVRIVPKEPPEENRILAEKSLVH